MTNGIQRAASTLSHYSNPNPSVLACIHRTPLSFPHASVTTPLPLPPLCSPRRSLLSALLSHHRTALAERRSRSDLASLPVERAAPALGAAGPGAALPLPLEGCTAPDPPVERAATRRVGLGATSGRPPAAPSATLPRPAAPLLRRPPARCLERVEFHLIDSSTSKQSLWYRNSFPIRAGFDIELNSMSNSLISTSKYTLILLQSYGYVWTHLDCRVVVSGPVKAPPLLLDFAIHLDINIYLDK
jgi:hypothetical protein